MAPASIQGTVIVVEDEEPIRNIVSMALRRAGCEVTQASDGQEALERVAEAVPDLIISDVKMPRVDGLELVRRLRADPATRAIPVILLTGRDATEDVVAGLDLGADDYLAKPFQVPELLARVRAKIERPPVPKEFLPRDRQTGLLSERRFREEAEREIVRSMRGGLPGCLAYLDLDELPRLREQFGTRVEAEIARQVAALIQADTGRLELAGREAHGRFTLLLPEQSLDAAQQRLDRLSRRIAAGVFTAGGERLRFTPAIGFASFAPGSSADQIHAQARLALSCATAQLDLRPMRYAASMERPRTAHSAQHTAPDEARRSAASPLCAVRCSRSEPLADTDRADVRGGTGRPVPDLPGLGRDRAGHHPRDVPGHRLRHADDGDPDAV